MRLADDAPFGVEEELLGDATHTVGDGHRAARVEDVEVGHLVALDVFIGIGGTVPDGDTDELDVRVVVLAVHLSEVRGFDAAGDAPRRPEVRP